MPLLLRQVFFAWLSLAAFEVSNAQNAREVEPPKEAREAPLPKFEPLSIPKSVFGDFSMMPKERDEYASNLTKLALVTIHSLSDRPQDLKAQLPTIRLQMALALNLSVRNRLAIVSNHQLGRGMLPEKPEMDYSPSVFARLLLTRGKLLKEKGTKADSLAGRCFVEMAAGLDPTNEDAIYEYEMQKLDGQAVDWGELTGE